MSDRTESSLSKPRIHRPGYLMIFLITWAIYGATALYVGRTMTPRVAYFDYLAESFVRGRVDLPDPPGRHDLCEFGNHVYVVFPPLPALLLTPWVWLSGRSAVNTVAFSICLAAANVTLAAALIDGLRRLRWVTLSGFETIWILAAFALGTAHWYAAIEGSAWFLGHICTLTFVLAAVLASLSHEALWVSFALLAVAMLGRPHVFLTAPLLLAVWRLRRLETTGAVDQGQDGGRTIRDWLQILGSGWPLGVAAALLAGYNQLRFCNPFEFGYRFQNVETSLMGDLQGTGVFGFDYVMRNLKTMLISIPHWDTVSHRFLPSDEGMSLILTAPAFLCCFAARTPRDVVHAAWWSVGLILIPLLLYYNAGWRQFGYRFSLDFIVPLLVLLILATRSVRPWLFRTLVILGIVVNAWGLLWWFDAAKSYV